MDSQSGQQGHQQEEKVGEDTQDQQAGDQDCPRICKQLNIYNVGTALIVKMNKKM